MIYFDNAATGFFKPRAVTDAVCTAINYLSVNPGRSGHRLSVAGARTVQATRQIIAEYFDASDERVIFTKNCTEALNTAIFGSIKKGGHVITTVYEHNSVLRPLFYLNEQGLIELDVVYPTETISLEQAILSKIKDNTYLIAVTAVSNVTGEQLPLKNIGKIADEHGLLFLVDGAQGGGHVALSMHDMHISYLALAGHKGLYGVMGSGVLILADGLDLNPLTMGGTGSESFNLSQPLCYPERLESGTLNLPAIAGLLEGVKYIKNYHKTFCTHLTNATTYMIEQLKKIDGVKVYSFPNSSGIVAFSIKSCESAEACDILSRDFDVAVRGGLHCAPLMHKHLKTDNAGLVRASLCVQNSTSEVDFFLRAVRKIASR